MSDIISKLKTPEECVIFEKNVTDRGHLDLAVAARKRAIELRAKAYGAATDAERECLEAVYAYERVLLKKHGRKIPASRTWGMIKRHGIIKAVERAVDRKGETSGYLALLEIGLAEYAFEAVVLRYPKLFSSEAVKRSQERVQAQAPLKEA